MDHRAQSLSNGNGNVNANWRSLAIGAVGLLLALSTWVFVTQRTDSTIALARIEAKLDSAISRLDQRIAADHDELLRVRYVVDDHGRRIELIEGLKR